MGENATRAIVLAAGGSKRFRRRKSKLLARICGRVMVVFPLKILEELQIPTTLVLGYQADELKSEVARVGIRNINYVVQPELLGTGNAVGFSRDAWDQENILILNADVPLLTTDLIKDLLKQHNEKRATISFLSTYVMNPEGYGRVVEKDGKVQIFEERDCPDNLKDVNKINVGIYVVKRSFLQENIQRLEKNVVSGEFYITDLIDIASKQGLLVQTVPAPFDKVRGVNTLQELWAVEQIVRSNLIKYWMNRGVRFELAQNIHIDIDVKIDEDSFIGTGVHLLNGTTIARNCFIGAFTIVDGSSIGEGCMIHSHSVIQDSKIGKSVHAGPFARLRNNVVIADDVTVGNFVEIKNSSIGKKSKTKHLTYIGDATLGENVNVGAGTIVCNYDGVKKHKTVIEDNVFVGSNDTLVAPIKIGKGSYVAAGSTITKDVHAEDLAIGRARQENKENYAKKFKEKKVKSKSAIGQEDSDSVDEKDLKFNFVGAVKTKEGSEENI